MIPLWMGFHLREGAICCFRSPETGLNYKQGSETEGSEKAMRKTLLSLAVLTAITPVYGQTIVGDDTERLIVTANRFAQSEADVLASIDVIDREEIELLQPASVVDLLARTSGLTFTQQGGAAQATSVFVRGTNANHVLYFGRWAACWLSHFRGKSTRNHLALSN